MKTVRMDNRIVSLGIVTLSLMLVSCKPGAAQTAKRTRNRTAAAVAVKGDVSTRGLKVCVAGDAPQEVREAAQSILAAVGQQPLLQAMAGTAPPTALTDSAALKSDHNPQSRAYSHLILVGLPTDPLIQEAWQREAKVEGDGFYVFGFGHLHGDIGYVESDRNPYMHGAAIAMAPYETEVVTITGSTPAGVRLAVDAFLKDGLVNGVVAAPGWSRPSTTVLDRDPLAPAFVLPPNIPAQAGGAMRIAVSQASEEEYRGVLADTDVEPQAIWRVKYYHPGDWDGAGADSAFVDYSNGLHRRAYGNTLWAARFASAQQAAEAAPKIAARAHLSRKGSDWSGKQPDFGFKGAGDPGTLALWQQGQWVLMSTLPSDDTAALRSQLGTTASR